MFTPEGNTGVTTLDFYGDAPNAALPLRKISPCRTSEKLGVDDKRNTDQNHNLGNDTAERPDKRADPGPERLGEGPSDKHLGDHCADECAQDKAEGRKKDADDRAHDAAPETGAARAELFGSGSGGEVVEQPRERCETGDNQDRRPGQRCKPRNPRR